MKWLGLLLRRAPAVYRCKECTLLDPKDGGGDGITTRACPRCDWCEWPPGMCQCHVEMYRGGDEGCL